jgi:uncharacterized protein YlzI (FlbEa/FlbD family)
MFIKVTKATDGKPIYINVNSIKSIEQDGDISIIMTNDNTLYCVKETADYIIQMMNYTNMLSVS